MSRTIEVDTKTFVRFWLVVAAMLIGVLLLGQALTGLLIVGAALFLALAIWPLVKKVDKTINKKKSRLGLSAGLVVGGAVLMFVFAVIVIAPALITETSRVISTAPEQIQNTISSWDGINDFGHMFGIDDAKSQIINAIKQFSANLLPSIPQTLFAGIGAVGSAIAGLILVVVLTILFLTQGPALVDSFWRKMGSKNSEKTTLWQRVSGKLANVVAKYVTGQVLVAILDGVVAALAVFILSLIFGFSSGLALPMGMIAMIFYLIPMFGPIITAILVSVILFFSDPFAALSFLAFYIVYEQIENNVIAPKVQGNSLSLPPLIILCSIVIGMYMFGLIGAIISIPIAGCIKVLIDEYPNIRALKEA